MHPLIGERAGVRGIFTVLAYSCVCDEVSVFGEADTLVRIMRRSPGGGNALMLSH